ncbi:MAG: hypothetical protein KAX49_08090 [Halanaerobiales bacterium]|nr:hypothetical protein [Halanaerobiales bacterium]
MSSIKASQIQFIQACPPALDAGEYRITVEQKVKASDVELPKTEKHFSVRGPRFALEPSDIYSVFPPSNHQGEFDNCLPHIILSRQTLPWERTLDGMPSQRAEKSENSLKLAPWMALLTFTEDETPKIQNGTVKDLLQPLPGIFYPEILLEYGEKKEDPCMVIDVPTDLFKKIVPSKDDLMYLAHVRAVDVDRKEVTDKGKKDGWFSTIISNRFPKSSQSGVNNIVHLVSLEGFQDYLPDGNKEIDSKFSFIRFVSLANWSFTGVTIQHSFTELAENLSKGRLQLPIKIKAETPAQKVVENAFSMGYVGLNHTSRNGEKTVSWYRGPLLPLKLADEINRSYPCADAVLRYNPDTGLFDVAYATAWQLGRLLALQNQHFAVAMSKQRRSNYQKLRLQLTRSVWRDRLNEALEFPENSRELDQHHLKEQILKFLNSKMTKEIRGRNELDESIFGDSADPSGLRNRVDDLPGLLSKEEVEELQVSDDNLIMGILRKLLYTGEEG